MFKTIRALVFGDTEHGLPDGDANAPVKVGGTATEEEPTAVEDGDRVVVRPDLRGNVKTVGNVAHDTADRGNPVKVGGVARTSNPTAVASGDRVDSFFDDVGRSVITPYQVRDLVATAQAATSTLAEVTLLAGVASTFHDLMEITLANNSTAAVRVSLRDNLAGGVVKTFDVPANNTIAQKFAVPVPQNEAANAWTIQNAGSGDISTTDVTVSATFIKNV